MSNNYFKEEMTMLVFAKGLNDELRLWVCEFYCITLLVYIIKIFLSSSLLAANSRSKSTLYHNEYLDLQCS